MYRLLIVDDEPIIVEGLYEFFSEYRGDSLDIYKAYSASQALDWLNKKRVDIVITDIKMPEIDGLQLLEKIKQNWPECKVIFLTGYDEFDFIYKAMHYDGVSYLLKTESYESIASLVERYLEEIINCYRNDELIHQAESKMKKALPLFQKEFLTDLIDGMEVKEPSQRVLDELEIPLTAQNPVIPLAGCIIEPNSMGGIAGKSRLYTINYLVERHLSGHAAMASIVYRRNYILWFLQPETKEQYAQQGPYQEPVLYFRNMLESVQNACSEAARLRVSFAIGSGSVPWSELFLSFSGLILALNESMRLGMESVMIADKQPKRPAHGVGDREYAEAQLKKLEILTMHLERGNREEFFRLFSEIEGFYSSQQDQVDYEAFCAISLLFVSYMKRHGIMDFVESRFDRAAMWDSKSYSTPEETFAFFRKVAGAVFDAQTLESDKKNHASIQKIKEYVLNHLSEDLSLNNLADMVYFNPKYLSRLFKQAAGCTLSEYIADLKIARAKELLVKERIKIHEIGKAVGYSSGPYFTKFFKKGANMTPQEYRESFGK